MTRSEARLEGRVAIVSGGARGIGRAIVDELLAQGASVVLVDAGVSIDGQADEPGVAEATARALPRCVGIGADVSEAAQAAVQAAQQNFGGVDLVVNNAAIIRDAFIFKSDPAAWDEVLRVNLTGAQRLLAAATPIMRESAKGGRTPGAIVNIVSTAGIYGNFGQSAYGAAKAGLIGLTRVVAHDLARSGIRCNAVAPFAATRVTQSIRPANETQAAYKEKALGVPAAYVARLVAYLCSGDAAAISGQLFGVRGREVFVFSQPRPAAKVVMPRDGFDAAALDPLRSAFADLVTDLEAFSADPIL